MKEETITREGDVKIVPYEPCHQLAFKALNEAWISSYWEMEAADYKALDHPEEFILNKGGYIFVALLGEVVVGVCALSKLDDSVYDYELTKLAVSPNVQGKGIGVLLCETVLAKAVELGGRKIFLESNTVLESAIYLYRKLGFKEVLHFHSTYARANIQMEWAAAVKV